MSEEHLPERSDTSPAGESQPQNESLEAGRRRLLQSGLAATPVILTLFSRSAVGQVTGVCKTPSGFQSGNLSVHGTPQTCQGRTPGYWKQSQSFSDWLAPYFPTTTSGQGGHRATKFKDEFSPDLSPPRGTFLEVLSPELNVFPSNGPPFNVARHVVAAALNIRRGWVPESVLTLMQLKDIWNEYASTGHFSPSAGVFWDDMAIIDYLLTTMPL